MKKKDRYRYEVDLILTTRQAYEVNVPANSPAEARKIARNNTEGASLVGEPSCVWSVGGAKIVCAFNRLWDTLSDILEEEGTSIPKRLRKAALDAIEQAREEKPDEA